MKTAILTDTNSGLTVEEGEKRGIYVLPMPVIVEENVYFEGVDITHDQLYDALRREKRFPPLSLRPEMSWLFGNGF